jgi:CDP-diacylglycerol---serine O-phosphatidyltransferase
MADDSAPYSETDPLIDDRRARRQLKRMARRRRMLKLRNQGQQAMRRGVYFLPSMATLGNALCGFAAIYVCTLNPDNVGSDPWAKAMASASTLIATYLVLIAAVFDALDGRLARMTRATTDFGGQLDSLADVISFGCAPAFIALHLFKQHGPEDPPLFLSRLVFAIGLLYVACAAIRLARFNVMNEHGAQHHQSFQGLPSPGAGLCVVAWVMLSQELLLRGWNVLSIVITSIVPVVMLACALLMVSNMYYPHLVNAFMQGRKSLTKVLIAVGIALAAVVEHRALFAIGATVFAFSAPVWWLWNRKAKPAEAASTP